MIQSSCVTVSITYHIVDRGWQNLINVDVNVATVTKYERETGWETRSV